MTLQLRQQRQWFVEVQFIARNLSHSPLMTNVRAGTFALKAFVVGNIGFIPFYCLVHLMWGQLAMPGYLGVQDMPDLLPDSI